MYPDPVTEREIARGEVLVREWTSEEGLADDIQSDIRALATFTGVNLLGAIAAMEKEMFTHCIVVSIVVAFQLGRQAMREEMSDNG